MLSKYKCTDQEQEILKALKLNQKKSNNLNNEMKFLQKSWGEELKIHEEFLSGIEKELGVNPQKHKYETLFNRNT